MRLNRPRPIIASLLLFLGGCSERTINSADAGRSTDAHSALDAHQVNDSAREDAPTLPRDAGGDGPFVHVHLRATHAEFEHGGESSGQTPRDWFSGIRSLQLFRAMDDPSPLLVFTHGDGFVEASYADGADTVVGTAPIGELAPGVFTLARVVHTHTRLTVDATAHGVGRRVEGAFTDFLVLSDRTTYEGRTYDRGDYRATFDAGAVVLPFEGGGAFLPEASGGFTVRVEEGETAIYFSAPIEVSDETNDDVHLIFLVNVHEGFRWTDLDEPDYREDIFDVSTAGPEPIVQAGANWYRYFLE